MFLRSLTPFANAPARWAIALLTVSALTPITVLPASAAHVAPVGAAHVAPALTGPFGATEYLEPGDGDGYAPAYVWNPECRCFIKVPVPPCPQCGFQFPFWFLGDAEIVEYDATAQVIENVNLTSGELQPVAQLPAVQSLAVDELTGNVLAQTASTLSLIGLNGAPIASAPVIAPVTALAFNKAAQTFAVVSLSDHVLRIYGEQLAPVAALSLSGLPLSGKVRVTTDSAGDYIVHADGSLYFYLTHFTPNSPIRWHSILMQTHVPPQGLSSDGTSLYFSQNGLLTAYALSGAPVQTGLTGLPAPGAGFALGY